MTYPNSYRAVHPDVFRAGASCSGSGSLGEGRTARPVCHSEHGARSAERRVKNPPMAPVGRREGAARVLSGDPSSDLTALLLMTHPCSVMVSEERAVRGERRVEPSPDGPWDASQPRLWCSRGILRLAPEDLRSLRMTGNLDVPLSPRGPVSSHETPPRSGVRMLRMTLRRVGPLSLNDCVSSPLTPPRRGVGMLGTTCGWDVPPTPTTSMRCAGWQA